MRPSHTARRSAAFPAPKVCGGCLNRRGLAVLEAIGLHHVIEPAVAHPHKFHWHVGARHERFELPEMCVIERTWFDESLAQEAVHAGASFLHGVQAIVVPCELRDNFRHVVLPLPGESHEIAARVVICADGLGRSSLRRLPDFTATVRRHSRIGVSATLPMESVPGADDIKMVVGPHGYVGLATCGAGRVNVAAALDPQSLGARSIGTTIGDALRTAGIELNVDWSCVPWLGTPALTSHPARVAAERLFVIGDASGYVEPFSGEGMATALATGVAVAPLAVAAADAWRPELVARWEMLHRELVVDAQSTCRQLAWILRRPWAAAFALRVCRAQPWIARRFIHKVS